MNYPSNHPFSPRYVSQIPVTTSDIKSAAAKGYIRRMQEEGKPNASKQSFPPTAALAAIYTARGHCPSCNTDLTHGNRKHRKVDGRLLYICSTCATKMDSRAKP